MIGFFDYVVTVITPSQILRNMNSEKFKGFDALDNNSACRDGVPSATIIIKKVNCHGFTFGWIFLMKAVHASACREENNS